MGSRFLPRAVTDETRSGSDDGTDQETHLRRALDLAREAAANGNTPFGSLLVRDGEVEGSPEVCLLVGAVVATGACLVGHGSW